MSKENSEKVVNEIIEYANSEIQKSKKRHFLILLSILISVIILSVALLFAITFVDGYMMWTFFGITAIISAILNVIWTLRLREAKWFRFLSMTLTVFTVCSFYAQAARWVLAEDWSALMDVLPTASNILWSLTITSVAINSISLFKKNVRM